VKAAISFLELSADEVGYVCITPSDVFSDSDVVVVSFSATTQDPQYGSSWFLDSGVSEHITNCRHELVNVTVLKVPRVIKVAKSSIQMEAKLIGDINLPVVVDGVERQFLLKNVLFAPDLAVNLVSVRRLDVAGFYIGFGNSRLCVIKSNTVYAVGYCTGTLYRLDTLVHPCVANFSEDQQLWHQRLGHISNCRLSKLKGLTDGISVPISGDSSVCEVCLQGKQTKLPHNSERPRAVRPLELIHSDIMGPVQPVGYDGSKYVITFIDDFTHFTICYCIKSKSQAFSCFKEYEAMASAHFNVPISRLRIDNGREYLSNEMKEYLKSKGILLECTLQIQV